MKWLRRLLGRRDEPDPAVEQREMEQLRRRAQLALIRAERLELELRRLEKAPWR